MVILQIVGSTCRQVRGAVRAESDAKMVFFRLSFRCALLIGMRMAPVLQSALDYAPWSDPVARKLPGIRPLGAADWLVIDDAYGGQMRLRDRLIAEKPDVVLRLDETARPAAEELLDLVVADLDGRAGYTLRGGVLHRPDGEGVALDRADVMTTLGRLCQDDFCILHKHGDEHVLTAAVLCFPASWSLDQKFLRPLIRIHVPVDRYDADIARRVQRLFDGVRPGQVLWRANALLYADPHLHQPRREGVQRVRPGHDAAYVRSERQCLRRLPESGAVVFSIHTIVVARENLTAPQEADLRRFMRDEAVHP
jgi:hypothetical protein